MTFNEHLYLSSLCVQKSLDLVKERGKYWKVFDDKYVFSDRWFYIIPFLSNFKHF